MTCSREIPDFSQAARRAPLRECDCPHMAGHCACPQATRQRRHGGRTIGELYREHHVDARLSGARRSEPNAPGMGTLSPAEREALLLRLEAFATAPGEPTRFAESTVQADLVSAFRDGDRHYLLVVPAGGTPVRIDVTGRLGAILAYVGSVIEKAGL